MRPKNPSKRRGLRALQHRPSPELRDRALRGRHADRRLAVRVAKLELQLVQQPHACAADAPHAGSRAGRRRAPTSASAAPTPDPCPACSTRDQSQTSVPLIGVAASRARGRFAAMRRATSRRADRAASPRHPVAAPTHPSLYATRMHPNAAAADFDPARRLGVRRGRRAQARAAGHPRLPRGRHAAGPARARAGRRQRHDAAARGLRRGVPGVHARPGVLPAAPARHARRGARRGRRAGAGDDGGRGAAVVALLGYPRPMRSSSAAPSRCPRPPSSSRS